MVHSAHSPALPLVRGLLLPRWLAIGRVCSRPTHARSRGSPRDAAPGFLPRAAPHSRQQHGAPSIPIIMEMITQAHTGPRHRPGDAGFLLWCHGREYPGSVRRRIWLDGRPACRPLGMSGFFSADRRDIRPRSSHFNRNGGIARADESSRKINGISDIAFACRSDDTGTQPEASPAHMPRKRSCPPAERRWRSV
jgi:hypothetical protein